MAEYYDSNVNRAEDGKLMSLLEEAAFTLEKCSVATPALAISFSIIIEHDEGCSSLLLSGRNRWL